MQVISITVWTKNHKSQNQNSLTGVPLNQGQCKKENRSGRIIPALLDMDTLSEFFGDLNNKQNNPVLITTSFSEITR